jgi:hypothetical protein
MRHGIRHHYLLKPAAIQCLDCIPAQDTMCHNGHGIFGAVGNAHVGRLDQRAAGISHVIHNHRRLSLDIANEGHTADLIGPSTLLVDQSKAQIQGIRDARRALGPTGIGRDDDAVLDVQVLAHPPEGAGLGVEVVDGDVEEALDLGGVQVHGDDVVAAGGLEHVGNELGGDGRAGLVLLVLAGVEEVGDDGGDSAGRGGFAGVDHDQQLHEAVVDVAGAGGLEDEDWGGG